MNSTVTWASTGVEKGQGWKKIYLLHAHKPGPRYLLVFVFRTTAHHERSVVVKARLPVNRLTILDRLVGIKKNPPRCFRSFASGNSTQSWRAKDLIRSGMVPCKPYANNTNILDGLKDYATLITDQFSSLKSYITAATLTKFPLERIRNIGVTPADPFRAIS